MTTEEVRALLESSRDALMEAIRGLTERDFVADLGEGETIVASLALLASAERETIGASRAAAGVAPRPVVRRAGTSRAVPPQVIHDLAGARYEALLFLDILDGARRPAGVEPEVLGMLAELASREQAVADRIRSRTTGSPESGATRA